eukprot:TRINITY_DN18349_c0_g1_i1.p1 TRINITY_DN18349_c0_g1~~TRINITY_DN18349_c0_g1_i1.p1  ORF type:complete len:799 (+),score=256.70 TRINITY_DN18349_c0_g1_i1:122-2518(+)
MPPGRGWDLLRVKSFGGKPAPERDGDGSPAPRKRSCGKLKAVQYLWWGKKGTVVTALPSQYGRPLSWEKTVEAVMKAVGHTGARITHLVAQEAFQRLTEDMFWYIYIDDFALVDHKQKVKDYLASANHPRPTWQKLAAPLDAPGSPPGAVTAAGAGAKGKRPVHLNDQRLLTRVERRVRDFQAIQDSHVGAGAGGPFAPGYAPSEAASPSITSARGTLTSCPASTTSPSLSAATTQRESQTSRGRKRRFSNRDRFPSLPSVMGGIRTMHAKLPPAAEEHSEATAKHILRTAYRGSEGEGEEFGDTLLGLLDTTRSDWDCLTTRSAASAGSLAASDGWSLWDGLSLSSESSEEDGGGSPRPATRGFAGTPTTTTAAPLASEAQTLVDEELQYLHTRMAFHYVAVFRMVSGDAPALRDTLLNQLPEILVKVLYLCFDRTMPYLRPHLAKPFQENLSRRVSFWLQGVERDSLDARITPARKAPQTRAKARQQAALAKSTLRRQAGIEAAEAAAGVVWDASPRVVPTEGTLSTMPSLPAPTPSPPSPPAARPGGEAKRNPRALMTRIGKSAAEPAAAGESHPISPQPPSKKKPARGAAAAFKRDAADGGAPTNTLLRLNRVANVFATQDQSELRQRLDSLRRTFNDIKQNKYVRPPTPPDALLMRDDEPGDAPKPPAGRSMSLPKAGQPTRPAAVRVDHVPNAPAPSLPAHNRNPPSAAAKRRMSAAKRAHEKGQKGRAKLHTYCFRQNPWYAQGKGHSVEGGKIHQSFFSLTGTSPLLQKYKSLVGTVDNPFREVEMKWVL